MGKLRIWFLSYILYFNLIPNLLIMSIWFLNFYYHINLIPIIIFWMQIDDMFNGQNKKISFMLMRQ